jgi:hypothetical protein
MPAAAHPNAPPIPARARGISGILVPVRVALVTVLLVWGEVADIRSMTEARGSSCA